MNSPVAIDEGCNILSVSVCLSLSQREREEKRILHKDKMLSTSRLFYKLVPDEKHSNTQYVKQEHKIIIAAN